MLIFFYYYIARLLASKGYKYETIALFNDGRVWRGFMR